MPIEKATDVHKVCILDNYHQFLKKVTRDYLDTCAHYVEQVELCREDAYIDDEALFFDVLFKNECNYIGEKTCVEDLKPRVPFKKRK